ncbi:Potassium voltage-gated channel subfamily H member 7 [Tetrabaena socialis]|uniref:Potassium voltage-gated channel subfamily H member 7 n=1 Tax=Tetrabaena socialis TaxID=47790 RepID=A0A2J7ZZ43_9CHLO|nr:Potassium voltage-gated channel subfamily H member 7 [Tetrabaena socialis]|eukprot:PNH05532.1 Potassium voltage-gated channel subfamily H member 7 [Tetrabaena socialis]
MADTAAFLLSQFLDTSDHLTEEIIKRREAEAANAEQAAPRTSWSARARADDGRPRSSSQAELTRDAGQRVVPFGPEARLTLVAFTPGEVIYREGDAGQHMFLVRQGCVLLRSRTGDVSGVVRAGEACGELALLPDLAARRRRCTAIAGRATDLVCLAGRDLASACKDHPESGALVQVPLQAGFREMDRYSLDVADICILIVFWLDMFVQFRTAYISDTGELVRISGQIAAHYTRTWFPLDLASSLPWDALIQAALRGQGGRASALLTMIRMTRLLKLLRLLRMLDRHRYSNVLRLVGLFLLTLLVAHWTGCTWHGLSEWLDGWPWIFDRLYLTGETSLFAQYAASLYYALVLVVGGDNLPAFNNVERVFYVLALIMGAVLYALIVSRPPDAAGRACMPTSLGTDLGHS